MNGISDIPARTLAGPLKKAAAWATSNAKHATKIPALILTSYCDPANSIVGDAGEWLQQEIRRYLLVCFKR
jgi:hypothetical protein